MRRTIPARFMIYIIWFIEHSRYREMRTQTEAETAISRGRSRTRLPVPRLDRANRDKVRVRVRDRDRDRDRDRRKLALWHFALHVFTGVWMTDDDHVAWLQAFWTHH